MVLAQIAIPPPYMEFHCYSRITNSLKSDDSHESMCAESKLTTLFTSGARAEEIGHAGHAFDQGKTEKHYRLGSYSSRCEKHSASSKCKEKRRLLQFGISGHVDFLLLYAKYRCHRNYYAGNSAVILVMLQVTGEISRPQTRLSKRL